MKVGDLVFLRKLKQTGEILSISKDKVRVKARGLVVVCSISELEKEEKTKKPSPPKQHLRGTQKTGALEIDLHGKTTKEAYELVKDGVNKAIMSGYGEVWFIHGRGSGALKKETAKVLSELDVVRSFKVSESNPGVTICYLYG
jgi:DNA mismatch repair protein MutS2